MQDFDVFESLKKETHLSLIAEIKVVYGKAVLIRNELNLFSEPFLSDHGNGWTRVSFPFNQSSIKDIKIQNMRAVFFARTLIISTAFYTVGTDTGSSWYTHPIFKELGDDLGVKLYG